MTRWRWAICLVLAGCDEAALAPRPPADAGARDAAAHAGEPPPPAARGLGAVTRIASRADVALAGPEVDAAPGDWMLASEDTVAVVSAGRGRIVDLGPKGGGDDLYYIDACAFDSIDRLHTNVRRIEPIGAMLHVVRRAQERPIALHTWIWIESPGILGVSSQAAWDADAARAMAPEEDGGASRGVLALSLGDVVAWGNTPTWVDGVGFVKKGGGYGGDFLARASLGHAYALARADGRIFARIDGPDPPGFHDSARTGETVATLESGGVSARRDTWIATGHELADTVLGLPILAATKKTRLALPPGRPPDSWIEIARCKAPGDTEGKPWLRFDAPPSRVAVLVPEGGCFEARIGAPGRAPGRWVAVAELATAKDVQPVAGTLRWRVREAGAPVPAKVLVRGVPPTTDPSWGEDPDQGAALNAVYALGDGERPLPPGKYRVFVQRGPEYDAVSREITITAGKTTDLDATLARVVDTRGWISADLHVHAAPSFDAPTPLGERVRSLVAVDVQVAAATDHNRVTDYGPTIRELGVGARIASLVGDEITTKDALFGHFNAFPLDPGAAPVPYEQMTPREIFAAARAIGAGVDPIVQVNHPRMTDIGYFDILRLDRDDVGGWLRRAPLFDASFDAIEIFNGDHYAQIEKVERVLADWYALLDAGVKKTATGNSDSHKVVYQEAGVPRNWVLVGDDDPAHLDARAFVAAVRAGRVVVSTGPFVTLEAAGQPIGSVVDAGDVELAVHVDAPPWIDVAKVEIVVRGKVTDTFPVTGAARPRFEKKLVKKLAPGDWVVVVVRGDKPMEPLHRSGAKPFAFTNPIFLR